jgi:peptidoglycan/xylan/chitin deacetylase (PgdA/CDA1 family)
MRSMGMHGDPHVSSRRFSLHTIGLTAFRSRAARRAAFRIAAARGRSIALVYHRVTPSGATPYDVPPNVSVSRFREHLEVLGAIGDIVPLSSLLHEPPSNRRLRIAISFDDDDLCHVDHALPALLACGVQATFFLSGRTLHGLGAYWWMLLEQLIAQEGLAAARRMLGVAGESPAALAGACEGTPLTERLAEGAHTGDAMLLGENGIRMLARAGMEIGFHTLHHPVLTTLADTALDHELRNGRDRLAEVVGAPVKLFAYPHGRLNRHVAERVRAAGYRAAFRTGACAIGDYTDPFGLGRLGPGTLPADDLLALVALTVTRIARRADAH